MKRLLVVCGLAAVALWASPAYATSQTANWFTLEGPVILSLQVNPTTVPEPATLLLVGSGVLAVARRRRKGKSGVKA